MISLMIQMLNQFCEFLEISVLPLTNIWKTSHYYFFCQQSSKEKVILNFVSNKEKQEPKALNLCVVMCLTFINMSFKQIAKLKGRNGMQK